MKKRPLALALLSLVAIGAPLAAEQQTADSPETLIATVNGKPYRLDVFRALLIDRLQGRSAQNNPQVQQQLVEEFMNLAVASQEAERRKLEQNREVIAALELARMQILANAALTAMANEIEVSDKELKDAYDQLQKKMSRTEYKARHILVKEENEAKNLIKQLDKGAKFEDLAKKHSEGPTGKDGGDLGWVDPAQMVAPFGEALTKLKPRTYTKEPVQTQFGWHIIKLEETRQGKPPAFEEIKPQLVNLVKRQKIGERLNDMGKNADIKFNQEIVQVKPADDQQAQGQQ
ncbi:peptidylprolyl isomerase [Caldichromatium japonicum]|uniref:peptidylprolyl isomerase n=1 Tax=Caldichromatium japonicum TaxID=2699430 RepID=A0A6G7VDG1_9GAMM|nr:peptidylprolyl isomerase [Caldichromatium japonicum]QIK37992.1 peptidylprolyl isomerase [Caldichromatium japonicum]